MSALQTFPTEKKSFNLGSWGSLNYHQWLHPFEGKKSFSERQINLISKYIKPGDIVVDIGAHTGDTTLPYSVAAGRTGTVIAFEPNPAAYRVLLDNIYANVCSHSNIIAVNMAVTENKGMYTFHYTDPGACNGGFAEMLQEGVGVAGNVVPVNVMGVNLERWLKKKHPRLLGNISFIKIDTEGYDKNILRSISYITGKARPLIQVELYDRLTEEERIEFFLTINYIKYNAYDFSSVNKDIDMIGLPLGMEQFKSLKTISGHDLMLSPMEREWKI
jgi:FkbM family methyltransferase